MIKRAIKQVSLQAQGSRYLVLLDESPVKTFEKIPALLPPKVAELVETEWQAHPVRPHLMPLTSIAHSMSSSFPEYAKLRPYLDTDCVLIRQTLPELKRSEHLTLQAEYQAYDVVLQKLESELGIKLEASQSLRAELQSEEAHQKMADFIGQLNPLQASAFAILAQQVKSLILPLALLKNLISLDHFWELSRMEVEHSIEMWGEVEGDHDVSRAEQWMWVNACHLCLET